MINYSRSAKSSFARKLTILDLKMTQESMFKKIYWLHRRKERKTVHHSNDSFSDFILFSLIKIAYLNSPLTLNVREKSNFPSNSRPTAASSIPPDHFGSISRNIVSLKNIPKDNCTLALSVDSN